MSQKQSRKSGRRPAASRTSSSARTAESPARRGPTSEDTPPGIDSLDLNPDPGGRLVQGEPCQVLVVDDEVVVRRVLTDYLQGKGYTVEALESGESALAWIRRNRPGIVLLDIFMPGVNGLEVLRTIRRETPQTHVLVISGFADDELERKVKTLGAIDCLRKPFDFGRLSTIVASCIQTDRT